MASVLRNTDDTTEFQHCYQKLMVFVFKEDERTRSNLNVLIDELIALDYSSLRMINESGNRLLRKLCSMIPMKQERLVTKVCQVIYNFIKYKVVSLSGAETAHEIAEYVVKALRFCPDWASIEILPTLVVLMEDYGDLFFQYQDLLIGKPGILIRILESPSSDLGATGYAVHCLRCLAVRSVEKEGLSKALAMTCFTHLLSLLHWMPTVNMHQNTQCKIVVDALLALHSLMIGAKLDLDSHLGALLAAVKAYMFHGMGHPITIPPQLFPAVTTAFDHKYAKESSASTAERIRTTVSATSATSKARGKKTRKKTNGETEEAVARDTADRETLTLLKNTVAADLSSGIESILLQPSWVKMTSSDSEFSDTETGQAAKMHAFSTKVRIAAYSCLTAICKVTDKRSMFGYWSSFIPDSAAAGNCPQVQTIFTSILKDPSPKCRMGALVALTAMLDGTKQFLAAAEESSNLRTSFTPLSSVLGAMIRELHRALLQALIAENYNLSLTQLIKCLATLVVNVPYHRLQPGLLSRVVKQIRHFLAHKDSNVRVACLTCLGALVSHQPPLMEVYHIINSPTPPIGIARYPTATLESKGMSATAAATSSLMLLPGPDCGMSPSTCSSDSGFDSQNTASPSGSVVDSNGSTSDGLSTRFVNPVGLDSMGSSGPDTPLLVASPGTRTPVFSDQFLQAQAHETSWLMKHCIRNVMPRCGGAGNGDVHTDVEDGAGVFEPLPVRLESLQVLASLTKCYFPIVRRSMGLMQDVIQKCLEDQDPAVKLHGCKVLDEVVQAVLRDVQEMQAGAEQSQALTLSQALKLWQMLLSGPLLEVLKKPGHSPLRASACDCISNVGQDIFSRLPAATQQECLRLVLHLTVCEDRLVVAASVRVLGVYVLYPCLSQDVSFMSDAANAILKCMSIPSVNVKIKAAWALGNLCDALVVNRDKEDSSFLDQFSDMLLWCMLNTATAAVQDSDKVKCNAVRAVGNIMRYLPPRILRKSHIVEAVAHSVKIILKTITSGPMKVRWNSCYAIANVFRNHLLLSGGAPWMAEVLTELCTVVQDCKNFKVRINAAIAFSIPSDRKHFGDSRLYIRVWDSLVGALKTADDVTDFAEFRYRDSLTEQVCTAGLHLISLAEKEDILALLPGLQTNGFIFQSHIEKFSAMKSAGKVLKAVQERLKTLAAEENVTADVLLGLKLLHEICLLQNEFDDMGLPATHKSAFQQIYD